MHCHAQLLLLLPPPPPPPPPPPLLLLLLRLLRRLQLLLRRRRRRACLPACDRDGNARVGAGRRPPASAPPLAPRCAHTKHLNHATTYVHQVSLASAHREGTAQRAWPSAGGNTRAHTRTQTHTHTERERERERERVHTFWVVQGGVVIGKALVESDVADRLGALQERCLSLRPFLIEGLPYRVPRPLEVVELLIVRGAKREGEREGGRGRGRERGREGEGGREREGEREREGGSQLSLALDSVAQCCGHHHNR